jgi:hypothetical protein
MNRLWTALVLLLVCIGLCIGGNVATARYTQTLTTQLTAAQKAADAGDDTQAYTFSQKALDGWQSAHNVLCTFLPHTRLEAVAQTIAALPSLARYGTRDQFSGECARGLLQVQNLKEGEVPALQNIL